MRSVRLLSALIGALVAAGCVEPSSVQCPGGLVCPSGTTCAAKQSVCIKGLCGNGIIDTAAGEVCDDGNIVDGDGCSADCTSNESCGNGIVDKANGEVCDKGADNASCDGCSADCKSDETCGNGIVDTCKGEVCDDGNNVSGDGCSADCKSAERCGNGVIDVVDGEICDKGADNANCDGCSPDCKSDESCGNGILDTCKGEICDNGADNFNCNGCSPDCKSNQTCGNGIVDTCKGEICDLGPLNGMPGAGCSADCKSKQTCGNGVVDVGEECDPGPDTSNPCGPNTACPTETAACNRDCTVAFCGDGKINHARAEECDDGVETAHCNVDCTLTVCGDGKLNVVAGEQCDAGNGMSPGACTPSCTNTLDCIALTCTSDSCTTSCTATADIANCNGNGAGAASCKTSACGDGHVNGAAGETCDNPGGADIAGCNGKNAGAVSCHTAVCGDGYVNIAAGEECDTLGGGDTQTCNGKTAGAASCKVPKCGDGYVNAAAGEHCDNLGGADIAGCNGNSAGAVACQTPSCGDGYTNSAAGEDCDTAGGADTAGCNGKTAGAVACKVPACGDSYANSAAGESCDNGAADSANCNGSSAGAVACHAAKCGDNYVNHAAASPAGGEQCDSGSANSNTGACTASCLNARCGDGLVEAGVEVCDTGFTTPGHGCAGCSAPDAGWSCTLPSPPGPSSCTPVCGDGAVIMNASTMSLDEACDDHNTSACGLCSNAAGCTTVSGASGIASALPAGGTIVGANTYKDGRVFTLSDGAHTLTFEFDKNGSVTAGNIAINVNNPNPSQVVCGICQAIIGSGLNVSASGTCPGSCTGSNASVVTLTNKTPGAIGNVPITTTLADSAFVGGLKGMKGGLGEDCTASIGCTNDADCASDTCVLNQTCPGGVPCGSCAAPTCLDHKKNGLETDVDCGGGNCPGCADLLGCISNSDCVDGICDSTLTVATNNGTCAVHTCGDLVQNGDETDVDCGGSCSKKCPVGDGCKVASDCAPPTAAPPVTATSANGVCDTVSSQTCEAAAAILQIVVTAGSGSVTSMTTTGLGSGDISACTMTGGTCVQSYEAAASVTLTATAAPGTVSWTGVSCSPCTVTAIAPTCSCVVAMSGGDTQVSVSTP